MQAMVEVETGTGLGPDKESVETHGGSPSHRLVSYREYLQHYCNDHDSITLLTSGDQSKYHGLQDIIAEHFLVLEGLQNPHNSATAGLTKKQIYLQQEHRHLGGSEADIARFNAEALKILQSLLLFGCYNDKDKIIEAAKVCYVAIKYHVRLLHPNIDADHEAEQEADGADEQDDDDDDDTSTTSTLEDDLDDYHLGYSSLVQNETFPQDEHADWPDHLNSENDHQLSNDDDTEEYDHFRSKANSDLSSSYSLGGLWGGEGRPSDLKHKDRPSQQGQTLFRDAIIRHSSGQHSVSTSGMTDKNHRGLYITRLCLRHDEAKQASVVREHVRQNQR